MKEDWKELLIEEKDKEYYLKLKEFVKKEYNERQIFPPKEKIFNALSLTGYEETKVVILGQDPYHGVNQAHGLSFSVESRKAKFPPSLRNLFKELKSDLDIQREETNLTDWAEQGILLLNTVLTVEASKAGSHRGNGWETFTDRIINLLNEKDDQIIFVLWGNDARRKKSIITNPKHKIIECVHPSPLSAHNGFFGSKPFSKINNYLKEDNKNEIKW